MTEHYSRRRILQTALAAAVAGLAGCGMPGGEGDEEEGGEENEGESGGGGEEGGNGEEGEESDDRPAPGQMSE